MSPQTMHNYEQEHGQSHVAYCPCCGDHAEFSKAGIQRWPARVAAAAGLPEVVQLWNCELCHSTISEIDLHF